MAAIRDRFLSEKSFCPGLSRHGFPPHSFRRGAAALWKAHGSIPRLRTDKGNEPNLPPAWKALETVTIGSLSTLFRDCKDSDSKKKVAKSLEINNYTILESWLESIRVLHNVCAHHSRLWNKKTQAPKIPDHLTLSWITKKPSNHKVGKTYSHLCYIAYIQQSLDISSPIKNQIKNLLLRYPAISTDSMGFVNDWQTEPLWM